MDFDFIDEQLKNGRTANFDVTVTPGSVNGRTKSYTITPREPLEFSWFATIFTVVVLGTIAYVLWDSYTTPSEHPDLEYPTQPLINSEAWEKTKEKIPSIFWGQAKIYGSIVAIGFVLLLLKALCEWIGELNGGGSKSTD